MTYGQLKFRMTQMFPSVSLDLIEGWIGDRYAEILGELPWSRLTVFAQLLTSAPYTVGTVSLTAGSTAITLTAGTWTAGMTGRAFRATGRSEFYEFTCGSAATATLDRPYEGPTSLAAGYSIFQSVYPLPADCVLLQDNAFAGLRRFDHSGMPGSRETGTPNTWASYMDDGSTPPRMQVELSPIPDKAIGIAYSYMADAAPLTATSRILQVWMDPAAMVEGVVSKIKRYLKDYVGAQMADVDAKRGLDGMREAEARGMAPAQMKLDSYYTSHRSKRWGR